MKKQTDKAAAFAQMLLGPDQMRLPDDLTAVLETDIQLVPQDAEAARASFAESLSLAHGYGYSTVICKKKSGQFLCIDSLALGGANAEHTEIKEENKKQQGLA